MSKCQKHRKRTWIFNGTNKNARGGLWFYSCRGGCDGIDLWACVRCPESGIQWCCCPVNCIYRWRHNQQLNRICYICKCNSLFCWLDMKPMRFHKYHLYFEAPQKTHKKHIFGDTFCGNGKHRDIFLILSQNDAWDFYSVSMFSANCPDTFLTLGQKRQICADTILIPFSNTPGNTPRHYFWYF